MMLPLSGSASFARRRESGQSVVEELSVQVEEACFQMNQVRGEATDRPRVDQPYSFLSSSCE